MALTTNPGPWLVLLTIAAFFLYGNWQTQSVQRKLIAREWAPPSLRTKILLILLETIPSIVVRKGTNEFLGVSFLDPVTKERFTILDGRVPGSLLFSVGFWDIPSFYVRDEQTKECFWIPNVSLLSGHVNSIRDLVRKNPASLEDPDEDEK